MGMKPSEPLVRFLRESVDRKGLNTASIATTLGVPRSELKHMLAGTEPLTVDLMIALAEILELGPEDLAVLGVELPEAPTPLQAVRNPVAITELPPLDPYGNHTEQILRLGFAIGCDMHILLNSEFLGESGIPEDTLTQFPDLLPIKLDAAFHHHNDPKFLPDCVQITLSFDQLVTASIPWNGFAQLTLIPLEPELPDIPDPPQRSGSHLRLIE
jgi:hypothetical protein